MKLELKMQIKMLALAVSLLASGLNASADTIPIESANVINWHIGADVEAGYVPATNGFLRGINDDGRKIDSRISGDIRAGFSFGSDSRQGMLYPGAYQGIGIGVSSFRASSLLGNPVSAYVYQGAPIVRFSRRAWLGYEWQFGAAFGWKHDGDNSLDENCVVSTAVTARMGIALKMHYSLTDRWQMIFGICATHFSNGNTSLPNAGVNSIGTSVGIAYAINDPTNVVTTSSEIVDEADSRCWLYDIMVFGAWRKRFINVREPVGALLVPGRFGVVGARFSPLYKLNRMFAVGPALDLQWDEGAGLAPYWIEGSYDEYIKFNRPPFDRQISVGVSAAAELTMPIFSVNVGLGFNLINPKGEKRFYQSLTLKTFLTRRFYLNVGYRLGSFSQPQNLMLGVGMRI